MDRTSPERTSRPQRNRATRKSVILAERLARASITVGGIGTILAVSLIFVFLLWVVVPLFTSGEAGDRSDVALALDQAAAEPLHVEVDEGRNLVCAVHADGRIELRRIDSGEVLETRRPFDAAAPTCASFSTMDESVVFGFGDGSIRRAEVGFSTIFLADEDVPEPVRGIGAGEKVAHAGGLVERTSEGQLRQTSLYVSLEDPDPTGTSSPVVQIDHTVVPTGTYTLARHADESLVVYRVRESRNMLTRQVTRSLSQTELPAIGATDSPVSSVLISSSAQSAYVVHADGEVVHFDLRTFTEPAIAERIDLVPEEGERLTAADFLLGGTTILAGDSLGRVRAWFPTRRESEDGPEEIRLALAHTLPAGEAPVTAVGSSARSRLAVVGYEDGAAALFHVTSQKRLVSVAGEGVVQRVAIAPKEDGIVTWTGSRLWSWAIDTGYPEASFAALFLPVWYEGYPEPEHVWQSSSGTDDFEPKLGLVPLVFGTIKATLYSLIFGAPIALLAAIFTSEFMHARIRASVKSTIELMASLPSVVLGFLAALVIAPYVQTILPAVLAALFSVPFSILLGAYLWQLLPGRTAVRWSGWQRFLAIGLTFPLGLGVAAILGPLAERVMFAGDAELWLDGQVGSSFGGWFFLLLPISVLATAYLFGILVAPRIKAASKSWSRARCARVDLVKFAAGFAAAAILSLVVAGLLSGSGVDVRGSVVDTFVQRNALIVGFVMGFAIIPIIYTLAEDALSEVPQHLREASLGAGATQWQTAIRIVIPTAMSGLFSALMIGLGRAVGETMIVLMAAGNTPIMELNVFNGFRTLSANIAVELPEAVRNSAHYRTLFLAALVLFAMTFVLNTIAEGVRRHFRKRTHAL